MNRINLVGKAIRDPEIKYLDSGKAVASVAISVLRGTKKKEGEQYPPSDIFNVKVWGASGEALTEHIKKGSALWVIGRLEINKSDKGTFVEVADAQWGFVPRESQQQEVETGF